MLSLGASRAEALSGIIRHALISALSPLMTQVGGTSCLFPAASFLLPLTCCLFPAALLLPTFTSHWRCRWAS